MNAMKQEAPERQEIEELLPWHAAGTLSRRDAQRVEEALAQDPELARRYALVRDELGETIHLNETLGAPSARALEQLFAKIDAEPARRQGSFNASLNLGSRISEFFASLTPRTTSACPRVAGLMSMNEIVRSSESTVWLGSSPAMIFASVVLPLPEGPSIKSRSPEATESDVLASTGRWLRP